jgi:hypothetical protein
VPRYYTQEQDKWRFVLFPIQYHEVYTLHATSIESVAGGLLVTLSDHKYYNSFDFIDTISLQGNTNFFKKGMVNYT